MYTTRRRDVPAGIHVIRIILALVFILSGFLKAVDPWGSALQIRDYLTAFGMEWLSGTKYVLSILQSAFELFLGLILLFNRMRSFGRFFVMLFMICFTILTLIIAITNPVSDCGCFGEAIKLTNWQTFFKNIVLLPLSIILFLHTRKEIVTDHPGPGLILLLTLLSLFPGLTALYSLPWIDFLPYKVGANIPAKTYVAPEDRGVTHTTLIYKDMETDQTHEFELSDTTWYDTTRWEFVDTRVVEVSKGKEPEITDFAIFNGLGDATEEILAEEEVFLLIADRLEEVDKKGGERFGRIASFARQKEIHVICLTTSPLEQEAAFQQKTGIAITCYNIDGTALKTLLRAHQGLVILEKGTIIAKKNLRQAPNFEKAGVGSGLEYVLGKERARNEKTFVVIYLLIILGLFIAKCNRHRN